MTDEKAVPPPVKLCTGLTLVPSAEGFFLEFDAGDDTLGMFTVDDEALAMTRDGPGTAAQVYEGDDDEAPDVLEVIRSWAGQARIAAVMAETETLCECPPAEVMEEHNLERWSCAVCGRSWWMKRQEVPAPRELREVIDAAAEVIAWSAGDDTVAVVGKDAIQRLDAAVAALEKATGVE